MSAVAAGGAGDASPHLAAQLWHRLAARMTPHVHEVVGFAKRLPGFHSLPQDDQLILIKVFHIYFGTSCKYKCN